MLLIIYDKVDLGTKDYISYLELQNIEFSLVEASDLVRNYRITDDGQNIIWENILTGKKIDFSEVSGIYYRLHELNLDLFKDYIEEDRFYVKKEWESYLIYRMNQSKKCISNPNLYVLSSVIMQYPFYFSKAQEIGIKVPFYYVSSNFEDLKNIFDKDEADYIPRHTVYNNTDFRIANNIDKNIYGIIEKPKGDMIIVDVVGDEVFTSDAKNKRQIKLEASDKKKLINLSQILGLNLMQIFMIKNETDLYLMYLSAYPNWLKHSEGIKVNIYKEVTKLLLL